jgi:uncharacterized protein (TIGR02285 family)
MAATSGSVASDALTRLRYPALYLSHYLAVLLDSSANACHDCKLHESGRLRGHLRSPSHEPNTYLIDVKDVKVFTSKWFARFAIAAWGIVSFLNTTNAYADDKRIVWAMMDWAPLYILKGGHEPSRPAQLGSGIFDRQLAEIVALLPGYQHQFVLANSQRIWADFGAGENFCYASAVKTPEREKVAYFVPSSLIPTVELIIRRDNQGRVSAKNTAVNLKQLVTNRHDLVGYIDTVRKYGPALDPILDQAADNLHKVPVSSPGTLLRALDAGRMDFTIEYPMVLEYQRRLSPFQHSLVALQIDDVPPMVVINIACTRNAWGREVAADIAAAVQRAAHNPSYRNAVQNWVQEPKQLNDQMDKFYDDLAGQSRP